jgi:hypothetical protein
MGMYQLVKLASKDIPRALAFTARTFVQKEPTSVALKLTTCDFVTTFADVMVASVNSGYSYAIVDSDDDIVAQSLSLPYHTFSRVKYGHTRETAPMFALFAELDKFIPPKNTIYIFAISTDVPNEGLATDLLLKTLGESRKDGYEHVAGDCTNVASQHLFKKHGFVKNVEVNYDTFEYGIKRPFQNIITTRGIQRMTCNLDNLRISN